MIKKHLKTLIITSFIILLPALAGLVLWNDLPDVLPTHWGVSGQADGYSGKLQAVLGLPLLMLAIQWVLAFLSGLDRKSKEQNPKVYRIVFWIIPAITCIIGTLVYCIALGVTFKFTMLFSLLFALMFIIIGNYLPKVKHNFTMGIKIKPTLESEANWNATHRMAGKLWVASGVLMLATVFLPEAWFVAGLLVCVTIDVVVPTVYSYRYRATHPEDDSRSIAIPTKYKKAPAIVTATIIPVILILVGILMFTGDVNTEFTDDAFSVSATYYGKLTVSFDQIDRVEYRDNCEIGTRTYGFSSARLLLGSFKNSEFDVYTRYSYTGNKPCVVIRVDDKILVVGDKDAEATKNIYFKLSEAMNEGY